MVDLPLPEAPTSARDVEGRMVSVNEVRIGWWGRVGYANDSEVSWIGRGVLMRRRPRVSCEVGGREESRRRRVAVSREELICGTGGRFSGKKTMIARMMRRIGGLTY